MPVGGLIAGGAGLIGGILKKSAGNKQIKEGKGIINNLQYPTESVPSEITNAAATGLPSDQYNQAMQNIQQQQLMAIRGAQDRRGGLASISGIQNATNAANLGLDVKNAQARQQNQFRLASWKDKVWQNNVLNKYKQQYNYGMGLIGAGNVNKSNGIDQGLAGFGQAAYGYVNAKNGNDNPKPYPGNNLQVDNTNQGVGNKYNTYG